MEINDFTVTLTVTAAQAANLAAIRECHDSDIKMVEELLRLWGEYGDPGLVTNPW